MKKQEKGKWLLFNNFNPQEALSVRRAMRTRGYETAVVKGAGLLIRVKEDS